MSKALVVLSGGQDSTTCLAWALTQFDEVHAITFRYGQKHAVELESAKKVAEMLGVASHEIVDVGPILKGTSPLVNPEYQVESYAGADVLPGGLEKTFVPGRNMLFLVLAGNRAYNLGCTNLVTGVCEEDFGGYPDCRQVFINSMENALVDGLAIDNDDPMAQMTIHTPLMHLTKKETVERALALPGCMEALAYSHTCYNGQVPPCGTCHACLLRSKGFAEAGVVDPLLAK